MIVELNARSKEVFRQIVDAYVATGEPVGSRTIARRLDEQVSPATIRNVMADLEEVGAALRTAHLGRPGADRRRPAALRRRPARGRQRHRGRAARDRGPVRRCTGAASRACCRMRRTRCRACRAMPASSPPRPTNGHSSTSSSCRCRQAGRWSSWSATTAWSRTVSSTCRWACPSPLSWRPATI